MFVTPPRSPRELNVRRAGGAYHGAFEAVFAILIAQRLIEAVYDWLGRWRGPGEDGEPTQSFAR